MIHAIAAGKINWTLEVLGRRWDDYHEVRSIIQTIDLHDELTFEAADRVSLDVTGPHESTHEDLVLQAARLRRTMRGYGGQALEEGHSENAPGSAVR